MGKSYDGWLDEPYNQPDPTCEICGEEIEGDVYEESDDDGREFICCGSCKGHEEDEEE